MLEIEDYRPQFGSRFWNYFSRAQIFVDYCLEKFSHILIRYADVYPGAAKAFLVEILLHDEAGPEQAYRADARLANFFRGGIGDMQQWNPGRSPHLLGNFVNRVLRENYEVRASLFDSRYSANQALR